MMIFEFSEQLQETGADAWIGLDDELRLVVEWDDEVEAEEPAEVATARRRWCHDRPATLGEYNAAGRYLFGPHWEPLPRSEWK